eukprot:UN05278
MPMKFTMSNFALQCQIALHNLNCSCHHQHRGIDRRPCANCGYGIYVRTGGGSAQLQYFPSTEPGLRFTSSTVTSPHQTE